MLLIEKTTTFALLIVFAIITLLLGFFTSRKDDTEDYLIANRSLNTFQSVMTICGSFIGAMSLLIYPAFVFTYGISAMWIFIGYLLGFIIFTFFALFLKRNPQTKTFYTLPDYFLNRFGIKTARWVMTVLFIYYFGSLTAQFIGSGKILSKLTGITYMSSVLIVAGVIIIYLLLGGFKSVVKTDIFQFIVLTIFILIIASVLRTGTQVPLTHMNPFNAGPVYIGAFLALGLLSPFGGQDYWQKVYAMKNEQVVKKSFIISGILLCLIGNILTYIGLVAKTQFPSIDPDLAVLYSFTRLVPQALMGIVSIAFFAAILSSTDTILFMLGMNFTNDILQAKNNRRNYTRLAITGIGSASLLLALNFTRLVDLVIIIKSIGLILPSIILFIWFTKGDSAAIIFSIFLTLILVISFALSGFLRPELSFVAIFGSILFYWSIVSIRRIISKDEST